MCIENIDKDTETAMNCFTSFILSNKDVQKFGEQHGRLLDLARLHDAERHIDKKELKESERLIIKKTMLSNGTCVFSPFRYTDWTDDQLIHILKYVKAFTV